MKFVSDLRQVGGFLRALRNLPPINLTPAIYLKYCFKSHTGMSRLAVSGHILVDEFQEEPGEYMDPHLLIYIQMIFSLNRDINFYFNKCR